MVGEEEVVGLPMRKEPIYDGKEYQGERKFIDDLPKKKKKNIFYGVMVFLSRKGVLQSLCANKI